MHISIHTKNKKKLIGSIGEKRIQITTIAICVYGAKFLIITRRLWNSCVTITLVQKIRKDRKNGVRTIIKQLNSKCFIECIVKNVGQEKQKIAHKMQMHRLKESYHLKQLLASIAERKFQGEKLIAIMLNLWSMAARTQLSTSFRLVSSVI